MGYVIDTMISFAVGAIASAYYFSAAKAKAEEELAQFRAVALKAASKL